MRRPPRAPLRPRRPEGPPRARHVRRAPRQQQTWRRSLIVVSAAAATLVALDAALGGYPWRAQPTGSAAMTARTTLTMRAPALAPPVSPAPPAATTPTPRPSPTAETSPALLDATLATLDLRHQVAQLFVVGVPLGDLGQGDALARSGVGGIFLAGRSTASTRAIAAVTSTWNAQPAGAPRPWVSADQEGGAVQSLRGRGFGAVPSAVVQGGMPPSALLATARGVGASLRTAGVNLALAPVADAVPAGTASANAPIGAYGREYAASPAAAATDDRVVLAGFADHGVTGTIKHFPGLGRVTANTDTAPRVVDAVTRAHDPQVEAFAGLSRDPTHPLVMVSSATYSQLDPSQAAVFSPRIITGLLRDDLGYQGPIVSDDLARAKAVAGIAPGERALRFLDAGGTLVLCVDASLAATMERAVLDRALRNPAFASVVSAAVRTDLAAKERAGLL